MCTNLIQFELWITDQTNIDKIKPLILQIYQCVCIYKNSEKVMLVCLVCKNNARKLPNQIMM